MVEHKDVCINLNKPLNISTTPGGFPHENSFEFSKHGFSLRTFQDNRSNYTFQDNELKESYLRILDPSVLKQSLENQI